MVSHDLPQAVSGMPVLRQLGEGGMGRVLACTDPESGRTVAVKLLHATLAPDDEMAQRFRREADVLTRVTSPHVVRALRTGESEHGPFLVMELLEGESAADLVARRGPLSLTEAFRLTREAALGLKAALDVGLVHRDVKPENLFVTAEGVKVVDFGLARPLDGSGNLTAAGLIVGSPAYVAPERSRGEEATVKSDVYALGATLFELLAGHPPYQGETEIEVLTAHIMEPLPDLRALRRGVPDDVVELVERMLAKDPDERVGSYDAVIAVLDRLPTEPVALPEETSPMPADPAGSSDAPPLPSSPPPGATGGVTALVGGGHPLRVWWEATRALVAWALGAVVEGTRRRPAVVAVAAGVAVLFSALAWWVLRPSPPAEVARESYPEDDIRGWTVDELAAYLGDEDIDDILTELSHRPANELLQPMVALLAEGSYLRRHRALKVLEDAGLVTDEHHQTVALRDIANGPTCEARMEGVDLLMEHAVDKRALEAVAGLKKRGAKNRCIDFDVAEEAIHERID